MTKARRAMVAQAVKKIKDFHALGRSLSPKQTHKDAYDRGVVEAEARDRGLGVDLVRKARQFAAAYTPDEVAALCRLIREVQAGQGDDQSVFGRSHLLRVLSVEKRRRAALQAAAVRGGWSVAKLGAEIAARYGSRRDGGRRRRRPNDVLGLLVQAERLCETWRRWAALVAPPPGPAGPKAAPPTPADLPPEVRQKGVIATAAVAKFQRALTEALRAESPRRAVRHQFRETAGGG